MTSKLFKKGEHSLLLEKNGNKFNVIHKHLNKKTITYYEKSSYKNRNKFIQNLKNKLKNTIVNTDNKHNMIIEQFSFYLHILEIIKNNGKENEIDDYVLTHIEKSIVF